MFISVQHKKYFLISKLIKQTLLSAISINPATFKRKKIFHSFISIIL